MTRMKLIFDKPFPDKLCSLGIWQKNGETSSIISMTGRVSRGNWCELGWGCPQTRSKYLQDGSLSLATHVHTGRRRRRRRRPRRRRIRRRWDEKSYWTSSGGWEGDSRQGSRQRSRAEPQGTKNDHSFTSNWGFQELLPGRVRTGNLFGGDFAGQEIVFLSK